MNFFAYASLCSGIANESQNENVLLVSVSDDRSGRKGGIYSQTQDRIEALFWNNPQFGINKFAMWKWQDIVKTDFYRENQVLLDNIQPDRNGRAYKPFVILEGLKSLNEGEYLIYTDASPEMWSSFSATSIIDSRYSMNVLKELCARNSDILTIFVGYDHTHANYTLDRCIRKMDLWEYRNSLQHASGVWVIRKTEKTEKFVSEWLYWNLIDECASLGFADVQNDYTFWSEEWQNKTGHRHDQSISGLLINRMGNKLVQIPRDYGSTGLYLYNFLQLARVDAHYNFVDSNVTK